ncbi:MAG: hypothetical protein KatS3mg087_1829 [Patescibacteria group bacterium]|nr:MAG: hypothetical protein KatS3mg087_1829 [Patescibacteria group bacterium]
MPFSERVSSGVFNNVTPVTIVPSPSSGAYVVKSIIIHNADTANVTVTVRVVDGGNNRSIIYTTLAPGDTLYLSDTIVLESSQSIQGLLAGTVTTNQPTFVASYGEST